VPWEQVDFKYSGNQKKDWKLKHDRFLVCWIIENGSNRWEDLQSAIRHTDEFAFDYLFRTRTPEELEKRCDMLVRLCAKRVKDEAVKSERERIAAAKAAERKEQAGILHDSSNEAKLARGEGNKKPIPAAKMPLLAKILAEAQDLAAHKCANQFAAICPEASMRKITEAIREIAVKEKKVGDVRQVWYIRSAFLHLLKEDSLHSVVPGEEGGAKRKLEHSEISGGIATLDDAKRRKKD